MEKDICGYLWQSNARPSPLTFSRRKRCERERESWKITAHKEENETKGVLTRGVGGLRLSVLVQLLLYRENRASKSLATTTCFLRDDVDDTLSVQEQNL